MKNLLSLTPVWAGGGAPRSAARVKGLPGRRLPKGAGRPLTRMPGDCGNLDRTNYRVSAREVMTANSPRPARLRRARPVPTGEISKRGAWLPAPGVPRRAAAQKSLQRLQQMLRRQSRAAAEARGRRDWPAGRSGQRPSPGTALMAALAKMTAAALPLTIAAYG